MTDNVIDHPKRNQRLHVELEDNALDKVLTIALDAMDAKVKLEKQVALLLEAHELISRENIYLRLIISTIIACGDAMTKEQRASVAAALKDVARRYNGA